MSLVDFLSNAAPGGILGSLGGIASKFIEGKHAIELKKLDNDKELRLSAHEMALTKVQLTTSLSIAELDARKDIAIADANVQIASYGNDTGTYAGMDVSKSHWALIFTDAVRGLVRPMLTATLVAFNVVIAFWLWEKNGVKLTGNESYVLLSTMINNIALCTSMAISWYFGARTHRAEG
jgi:hypothetical protein